MAIPDDMGATNSEALTVKFFVPNTPNEEAEFGKHAPQLSGFAFVALLHPGQRGGLPPVAALHFRLPLLEVSIRDDGTGRTSYCHHLGLAECERWTITTFAGPEAEIDMFGDHHGDRAPTPWTARNRAPH